MRDTISKLVVVGLVAVLVATWVGSLYDEWMPDTGKQILFGSAGAIVIGALFMAIAFRREATEATPPSLPIAQVSGASSPIRPTPPRRRLGVSVGSLVVGLALFVIGAFGLALLELGVAVASLAPH